MKKIILAAFAVLVCAGCQSQPATDCGTCVGNACPIDSSASGAMAKAGEHGKPIQSNYRKIPLITKLNSVVKQSKTDQVARMENQKIEGMSGAEGNYNSVKLPGIGHKELKEQESPFLVRSFKKSVWPGGIPLEAEIDPDIMNF